MSSGLAQYSTQEPPAALFFERVNYISVNLGLIAYGMTIISVLACMYYLYMEKNFKKNVKWMVFVFFLFVSATINVSMNMTFNEWAWIDFRGFPGGPFAFLQEEQSNVINTVGNSFGICTGFLTDALLIYRVHVVYRMWYVTVIPILTWIATTILGALFVVQAALPNSSIWAHSTLQFSLPYFSMALGLNIILTGMLVGRLLYMRHKIVQSLPSHHGKSYTNIIAMILESATPYGIVSFVFLVPYARGDTAALLFIPLYTQVQCLSPMLIIMRVARGRAWSNETISKANLSRMNHSGKESTNLGSFSTAVNPALSQRSEEKTV